MKYPEKLTKRQLRQKQNSLINTATIPTVYHLSQPLLLLSVRNALGDTNIVIGDGDCNFDDKSVIIGNIRMGFGHYRISMALASAARSMGYQPYWFDLHSFQEAACGKIIAEQNKLYSWARGCPRLPLFNKIRLGAAQQRGLPPPELQQLRPEDSRAYDSGIPRSPEGYPIHSNSCMACTGGSSCRTDQRCQCYSR